MAVDNNTLQNFFNRQKKPRIDALISLDTPKKTSKKIELTKNDNEIVKLSANKTINKVISNRHQSDTKLVSNQYQSDTNTPQNWYQSGNKTDTATDIKLVSNQYQSDTKAGFFSLTGLQKEIALTIYKICQISRDKKTDAVSISQLANQCRSTVGAVKIAVHRLIDKGILLRESFKNGRGGWTVYSVPNNVYQEIFNLETQNKLVSNQYQTGTKLVTKLVSEVIPTPSSSSSFNNYIKTTTSGEEDLNNSILAAEWQNIDIESLSEIGFTITHLSQIASQNKLPPQTVQDSIHAFAFDLEKNDKAKKIKGSALNYFMGILRNGMPYALPQNYESPQDRAMRLYLERVRETELKRVGNEKEAMDLAFNDWFKQLSDAQKREYVPNVMRHAKPDGMLVLQGAKGHFEKEIWPEKRTEIMGKTTNFEKEEAEHNKN